VKSSPPDRSAGALVPRTAAPRSEPDPALVAELRAERSRRVATVQGAVRALAQLLAVVDPVSYTQALRVQATALSLARQTDPDPDLFAIESAAVLRPLGALSLAQDLQERAEQAEPLPREDADVLASVPRLTDRLLAPIPGIEEIRSLILLWHHLPLPPEWTDLFGTARLAALRLRAAILRIAATYEVLLGRGMTRAEALGLLRNEAAPGDLRLAESLALLHADAGPALEMRSLPVARLRVGMVIAEALYTQNGQLLVNRGFEITESFLERVANFRRGFLREPVQVILPPAR
jgi:hypothetical protein